MRARTSVGTAKIGWTPAAALALCVGLGCGGAAPRAEATSASTRADPNEPDRPAPGENDEPEDADGLSAYLRPVREMLDALDRGDAGAVVEAFAPEARSDVRTRVTAYLGDPEIAAELRETLRQLIQNGRLIRADAQRARIAVPVRYGPAMNLAASDGRWYVEDTSETTDADFPGELPEEEE